MQTILFTLLLALAIEFLTIYLRLVVHTKSAVVQKKLHMPRIHHSYPGLAILLLDYVYLQNEWLFIVGFALILSDIVHHLIFEPYIKRKHYDIGMRRHNMAHQYASRLPAAIGLIFVGLAALVTPFTPGSWLSVVGIGMLFGKKPKGMTRKIKRRAHDTVRAKA